MKEVLTIVRSTCDACKREVAVDAFEVETGAFGPHVGVCTPCAAKGFAIYARAAPGGGAEVVVCQGEAAAGLRPWVKVV